MYITEMSKSDLQRVTNLIKHRFEEKVGVTVHFTQHALERATDGNVDKNMRERGIDLTKENMLEHWTHIMASIARIADIYKDAKTGKLPLHMFSVVYNGHEISEESYLHLCRDADAIAAGENINGDSDPIFNFVFQIVFKDVINYVNTAATLTISEDYRGEILSTSMVVKTVMVTSRFLHDSRQIGVTVPSNKGSAESRELSDYLQKYHDLIAKYQQSQDDYEKQSIVDDIAQHSSDLSTKYGMKLLNLQNDK